MLGAHHDNAGAWPGHRIKLAHGGRTGVARVFKEALKSRNLINRLVLLRLKLNRPALPSIETITAAGSQREKRPLRTVFSTAMAKILLERAMGFEPTTPTLARLCSTPELRPHSVAGV